MHFKSKLILSYLLLIIALTLIISFLSANYLTNENKNRAILDAEVTCARLSDQVDKIIQPMEYAAYGLLSDVDLYSALRTLSTVNIAESGESFYIYDASALIRYKLRGYAISRQFYRTSIATEQGYFFTNRTGSIDEIPAEKIPNYFSKSFSDSKKRFYILPEGFDPWALSDQEVVFGIIVPIKGMKTRGFVEIQRTIGDLAVILDTGKESQREIIAVNDEGNILFASSETSYVLLDSLKSQKEDSVSFIKNPETNRELISTSIVSDYSGVKMILYEDKSVMNSESLKIRNVIIWTALAIISISIFYILFVYNRITQPIRNLQKQIEATNAADPEKSWSFSWAYDEIESLNDAIIQLLSRLNKSFETEKKILLLNEQANYDLLQAQINPHFIYNILNLLSYRGVMNNDGKICDICDCLAAMLRYSTNTVRRFCRIREELEYLKNYIMLLKMNYNHKLDFMVRVSKAILEQKIPKLVLQQFVENCVKHGFDDDHDSMQIQIDGLVEDGWWYITVADNGKGFSREILSALNGKFAEARKELSEYFKNPSLKIGGLGVVNSYCRMQLLYRQNFIYQIGNGEEGAKIRIGAVMSLER